MIEQFEKGVLFSKEDWLNHVAKLKKKTVPSSKAQVREAFLAAVKKRIPQEKFGLLLSAGLDSGLLAVLLKEAHADFIAITVGMKGSSDVESARALAKHLKLQWVVKEFSEEEMHALAKDVAPILPSKDPISVGVGCVEVAALRLGKENGVRIFFGGLGSEEIFAGYKEHAIAKDVNASCWNGLSGRMYDRDLQREGAIGKAMGIEVRCPFLDDDVIVAAMGMHGDEKVKNGHKKFILREIAEELGLPKEFAWRKRLAAQYGSGFDKTMEKLAKKNKVSKREYARSLEDGLKAQGIYKGIK